MENDLRACDVYYKDWTILVLSCCLIFICQVSRGAVILELTPHCLAFHEADSAGLALGNGDTLPLFRTEGVALWGNWTLVRKHFSMSAWYGAHSSRYLCLVFQVFLSWQLPRMNFVRGSDEEWEAKQVNCCKVMFSSWTWDKWVLVEERREEVRQWNMLHVRTLFWRELTLNLW